MKGICPSIKRIFDPTTIPPTLLRTRVWPTNALHVSAENIWIDPWLRSKSRHAPSRAGGIERAITVFFILLIVAQVLVVLDRGIPLRKRIGTGLAAFSAVLLCVLWTRVITGRSALPASLHRHKSYSVTLTWKTSKSLVHGYNVYRSTRFGGPYA